MAAPLTPRSFDTRGELAIYLEHRMPRAITLGTDAEAPREYFSFTVTSTHGDAEVGVVSSGLTKPVARALGEVHLLVAHDTSITSVDLSSMTIVTSMSFGVPVYEFIDVGLGQEVVVIHELGVARVDARGREVWAVTSDVIVDWHVEPAGFLAVETMDDGAFVVSLTTGEITTPPVTPPTEN